MPPGHATWDFRKTPRHSGHPSASLDGSAGELLGKYSCKGPPWVAGESRHTLAQAMGRKLRLDRTADGDALESIEGDIDRSYQRITQAPIAIVLCVDMHDMDHYRDQARNDAEYLMAVQSTAMAAQNLLLATRAEGLGACIMCAPLFCPDLVIESLQLPRQWRAHMLATIGEPATPAKARTRLPLDQVTQWRSRQ